MRRDDVLALKIVNKALQNVKNQLEPLTYAVNLLTPVSVEDDIGGFVTDAKHLYFNSLSVLHLYERGCTDIIEYQIIHILLHGIMGHFSDTEYTQKKLAWRVMDLQVEQILDEMGIRILRLRTKPSDFHTIGMSLYHQAIHSEKLRKKVLCIGKKRQIDDHTFWWDRKKTAASATGNDNSGLDGSMPGTGSDSDEDMIADKWSKAREYLLGNKEDMTDETFRNIAQKLKEKNKGYGLGSNDGTKCVQAASQEYRFADVFKEFLQSKTVTKDQPDFHDRILYQYGLDLYENIPLLEPEEEIEDVQLKNVVIAIDTSGSCDDYVSTFLAQLISIFREISSNFHFEKIYLMQCDASIKNVCEFSDIEELSEVKGTMNMYGFGGTSFMPVFRWVERNLLEEGKEVDCLLYFSDCEGSFPPKEPEYPVFFIVPDCEFENCAPVPRWVRRIKLEKMDKE